MDITRAGQEPVVVKFYRQYMQQIHELTYPPGYLLVNPDVQNCLYKYFFDASQNSFLPPPRYQAKVLRRVIDDIEKSIKDSEEEQVSDELMEHRARLSVISTHDEFEDAQTLHVHTYYPPIAYEKPGVLPILIKEAPNLLSRGNNVGLRTWEAAMHLAWYLFTQRPELVEEKRVLELGAGTGFLSLLCAGHLEAKHVLATDGMEPVCEGLQTNIDLNIASKTIQIDRAPEVLQLDWGDVAALDQLLEGARQSGRDIDLVIGADITYHPDNLRPLARMLSTSKDSFPNIVILISAAIRSDTYSRFKAICEQDFHFKVNEKKVDIPDGLRYSGFFHSVAMPLKVVSLQR